MTRRPSGPLLAFFLVALLSLIWGINWPYMKIALEELPPWTFRAIMLAVGGPGLLAVGALAGYPVRVPRGQWWPLILVSTFMITIWMILSAHGLSLIDSGRAAILAFTMPVWATLLGVWILGEQFTARRVAGLALGMAGIAVLLSREISAVTESLIGTLFMIASSIVWAIGVVLHKKMRWEMHQTVVAGWQLCVAAVPMTLGALLLEHPNFGAVSTLAWSSVLYNISIVAVLAYILWFKIVTDYPAAVGSVSILLTPVFGVIFGALMLDEVVGWPELTSLALIFSAIGLVLFDPATRSAGSGARQEGTAASD